MPGPDGAPSQPPAVVELSCVQSARPVLYRSERCQRPCNNCKVRTPRSWEGTTGRDREVSEAGRASDRPGSVAVSGIDSVVLPASVSLPPSVCPFPFLGSLRVVCMWWENWNWLRGDTGLGRACVSEVHLWPNAESRRLSPRLFVRELGGWVRANV